MTLGMACGGATIAFLSLLGYSALAVWFYRGSTEGYFATASLVALVVVYVLTGKKTRRGGRGKKVTKGEKRRRRRKEGSQTYLLAQMPHGIMPFGSLLGIGILSDLMEAANPLGGVVASALLMTPLLRRAVNWLGVRKASTRSIVQMFADGLKSVGVVTGGIAEMFVSTTKERLVAPRPNFSKIALKGGHHIVVVFVYGTSRTHRNILGSPTLSRMLRVPATLFHGAFLTLPYRETLTMVIGKPIVVERVEDPTDADVASLRKRVEAEIQRLYLKHLPKWETRPLEIIGAASSPAEREAFACAHSVAIEETL
eukprot:g15410.t1